MKQAYAHQEKIVTEDPKKTGLFLGTGSGKTRIALLLSRGRTLVICPKTQRDDRNWQREFDKLKGNYLPGMPKAHELAVFSKEEFRRDYMKIPRFDTVILDEGHTCLGVTPNTRQRKGVRIPRASQIFESVERYLKRVKPTRFYICTATIIRSPMTVWAAAKLLGKKIDYFKFRERFYVRLPMPFREVYAPRQDSKTKDLLAKLVRSIGYVGRLEDFFDVPEQTWKTDHIELTAKQKECIAGLSLEYPDPLVRIMKQHQVENGVLAGDEFTAPQFFENGKIEKILDYASEFPRMVVFAKYRAQIEQIETALKKSGKTVFVMTGDTKDRGKLLSSAAKAKDAVFVCQAQISAGWELKEYPVMIFASRTNSFVDYDQGKGRIQRADNIKKNLYIKLIAGGKNSVDDAVDFSLENKEDFNERIYLGL